MSNIFRTYFWSQIFFKAMLSCYTFLICLKDFLTWEVSFLNFQCISKKDLLKMNLYERLSNKGGTTLSIMTLSTTILRIKGLSVTLRIIKFCHYAKLHYAECCILLTVVMNVIMLRAIMLNVIYLIHSNLAMPKLTSRWQHYI